MTFAECVELAARSPDTAFCRQDLPRLEELFEKWRLLLICEQFTVQGQGYACIYFPDQVELEISAANPGQGWAMTALVQTMLWLEGRRLFGTAFCLPLPEIKGELKDVLKEKRLAEHGHLLHAFCLFSFLPAESGCARCSLHLDCPQKQMEQGPF